MLRKLTRASSAVATLALEQYPLFAAGCVLCAPLAVSKQRQQLLAFLRTFDRYFPGVRATQDDGDDAPSAREPARRRASSSRSESRSRSASRARASSAAVRS